MPAKPYGNNEHAEVEYVAKRRINGLFYHALMKGQKKASISRQGVSLPIIPISAAPYDCAGKEKKPYEKTCKKSKKDNPQQRTFNK
jgi:hypothetical protein